MPSCLQTVGEYMIEIWRATGMDMNNVEFLWASEEVRRPLRGASNVMTAVNDSTRQGIAFRLQVSRSLTATVCSDPLFVRKPGE